MMPVGPLMIEHRLIERMIAILEKHVQTVATAEQIDLSLISQGVQFLRQYADRCHHGKEEDLLFKALKQKNIAVKHQRILEELMEEHTTARETVKNLALAVEDVNRGDHNAYHEISRLVKKIATLYPPHIEKEDQSFFLPIMNYFNQEEKDLLLKDFAYFDKNLIHDHYRLLVESLESAPASADSRPASEAAQQDIYECSVCGYHYNPALGDPENGIKPGTPFSELPSDWTCPICRASKDMFQRLAGSEPVSSDEPRKEVAKEYRTQDIVVHWFPQLCSHAGKCWNELPQVFKPEERPWIDLSKASPEELIRTIDKCPSRALKYSLPEGSSVDPSLANGPGSMDYKIDPDTAVKIRVIRDGPLLVEGPARVFGPDGQVIKETDRLVLCRCGKTKNPPFCDGSHMHNN